MLKYYDKAMCSNNIQHNMTEWTWQQHTTNKEIEKYKIKHKTVSVKNYSIEFIKWSGTLVAWDENDQMDVLH